MLNWPDFKLPPINLWSAPKLKESNELLKLQAWQMQAIDLIAEKNKTIEQQQAIIDELRGVISRYGFISQGEGHG